MDHADDGDDDDVFVYMGGRVPQHLRYTITHAVVDRSVKIITRDAFFECYHLVSIEIHDGVGIIEEEAFYHCVSLRGIKLPGVRVIGAGAFYKCTALADLEFGDKLEEKIGASAFAHTALKTIKLPKVRVIDYCAFWGCKQLTDVELSKDLETIEGSVFSNCRRLRRIVIPLKPNLLGKGGAFSNCDYLSTVELVGGIHQTISSLLLDTWRNEMNDEIDRINQLLPNTDPYYKTAVIRRWMESVLERIEHYKSKRASDDEIMEEATMNGKAFDQSEELKQQDDPKEQAAIHNDLSRREEDETDKSISSAGGSNLEDEVPEAEIEGMAVEIKDDSSFGGGDQNGDFRTESDVSSEEGRQSDFAQSTKRSGGESEIQRLKDQLKETQKRLKESEEDKNQQRKEYESNNATLQARLKESVEEINKYKVNQIEREEEISRLNKRLKVSVQTSNDLLGAAFKEMKVVHEPEVIRQLAEEGLLECLQNHKVELGQSKIEGARVGAFAVAKISKGERIFHFNGAPSNETISLTEDKIATLPPHVQRVVRMYTIPDDDGVRDVPKNGFSLALGISWFLNTALALTLRRM